MEQSKWNIAVRTDGQLVDVFTKALPRTKFEFFHEGLRVGEFFDQGEYNTWLEPPQPSLETGQMCSINMGLRIDLTQSYLISCICFHLVWDALNCFHCISVCLL